MITVKQAKQGSSQIEAIGYIRVSTEKQEVQAQQSAISDAVAKHENMKLIRVESETISSRKADRQIYGVIETLKAGQVLVVYELSRLGRSLTEILNIVEAVKKRRSSIWVLSPEMKLGTGLSSGEEIQAETMIFALGIGARIERDLISERTKNALRERKAQGVKLGRPVGEGKKVEALAKEKNMNISEIDNLLSKGLSPVKMGSLLGCDARTVRAYLRTVKAVKK